MMLHAALYGTSTRERQMLFEHLELLGEHDLLVLDRGYPASWLMAALQMRGIRFCMRIDGIGGKPVTAFLRSGAPEAIVTLPPPHRPDAADYELERAPVTVRLIRVVTPEGRVRVLATSLLDACRWPSVEFGALYHQRWRVEEAKATPQYASGNDRAHLSDRCGNGHCRVLRGLSLHNQRSR